jgi:hypothetical protein
VLAHVLFWLLVNPVNQQFAAWTPDAVPPDRIRLRDQRKFTHAARAGLFLPGFWALLASVFAVRLLTVPGPGPGQRGGTTG